MLDCLLSADRQDLRLQPLAAAATVHRTTSSFTYKKLRKTKLRMGITDLPIIIVKMTTTITASRILICQQRQTPTSAWICLRVLRNGHTQMFAGKNIKLHVQLGKMTNELLHTIHLHYAKHNIHINTSIQFQ